MWFCIGGWHARASAVSLARRSAITIGLEPIFLPADPLEVQGLRDAQSGAMTFWFEDSPVGRQVESLLLSIGAGILFHGLKYAMVVFVENAMVEVGANRYRLIVWRSWVTR